MKRLKQAGFGLTQAYPADKRQVQVHLTGKGGIFVQRMVAKRAMRVDRPERWLK